MKMELLRNCAHGSEIVTYLVTNEFGGKSVIKTSTTPGGIKNLRNEVEGWHWYQAIRYPSNEPICMIAQQREKYLQIQINYIDGNKPDCRNGLVRNADVISKVVQHYCHVWPHSFDFSPMHGDFSLDNLIINSEGVHIIDWEHFTTNGAPWGFDVMYLLFESLYFSMRNRNKPTGKEIQIICEHIETMNNHQQLQHDMIEAPLRFIKEFVFTNHHLWGEQIVSFQIKLPIIAFSSEQVTTIDEMIGAGMVS